MVDHSITLTTNEEMSKDLIRAWYHTVKDNAPAGTLCTTQVDGKSVQLVRSKSKDTVRYTIPLTRDLTSGETKSIIDDMSHRSDIDFKVSTTYDPFTTEVQTDIVVNHEPLVHLCTKWAKDKHEQWRKRKEDAGWRYGPSVSKTNKTHPLLRPWDEIPAEYRKVDVSQAQELLDLLHDAGYVMVHKDDLDRLMED